MSPLVSTQHSPDISIKDLREAIVETVVKPTIPAGYIDGDTKFYIMFFATYRAIYAPDRSTLVGSLPLKQPPPWLAAPP